MSHKLAYFCTYNRISIDYTVKHYEPQNFMQHLCPIYSIRILEFRNQLKFTLTDDEKFYKKVIPENELDVSLDDECKYCV